MSASTSRPLGFLDLSAEIRSKVYEHYFANTAALIKASGDDFSQTAIMYIKHRFFDKKKYRVPTPWNLIYTCRSCYHEARAIMYGIVTVYIPSYILYRVPSSKTISVQQAAVNLRSLVLDAEQLRWMQWTGTPLEVSFPRLQEVTVDANQLFLCELTESTYVNAVEGSEFHLSNGDDMGLYEWVCSISSADAGLAKLASTNVTCNGLRALLSRQLNNVLHKLLPLRASAATCPRYKLCVRAANDYKTVSIRANSTSHC